MYRVEAVDLSFSNYTFEITIFVNLWNFGQFREKKLYFVNNRLIKARILDFLFCTYGIHFIVIIYRTPHFVSSNFLLNQ